MPISSFYGLQTSLRGLLAQQRALDTPATTSPTRHAGLLAPGGDAAPPRRRCSPGRRHPAAPARSSAPASTSQGYRRIRDQFLDLQYRAPEHAASASRPRARRRSTRPSCALAEPGDNGINAQLVEVLGRLVRTSPTRPSDAAARAGAASSRRSALADAFKHRRRAARDRRAARRSDRVRRDHRRRAARSSRSPARSAELNDAIKRFVTAGDAPNDLMDRRDLLLDKLSKLGQVSVTDHGRRHASTSSFGGVDARRRRRHDRQLGRPARRSRAPGGKLGALLDLADARRHDRLLPRRDLDTIAADLATRSTRCTRAAPARLLHLHAPAPTTALDAPRPSRAAPARAPAAGRRERPRAGGRRLRGGDGRPGLPRASSRAVGTDVSEADARARRTRRSLADSVEDRRQSVAGVSLDEEMTNLVRFQRAYQASARAMSTELSAGPAVPPFRFVTLTAGSLNAICGRPVGPVP